MAIMRTVDVSRGARRSGAAVRRRAPGETLAARDAFARRHVRPDRAAPGLWSLAGPLAGRDWWMIAVKAGREDVALALLADRAARLGLDAEALCPARSVWRYPSKVATEKARYSFAAVPGLCVMGLRGAEMVVEHWTVGPVRGVLRAPGGDGRIGERAVAVLARCGDQAVDAAARMQSGGEYAVGDVVEIDAGPLAGLSGVVEHIGARTARVACALLALGRVEARLDHLRLAS